MGSITDEKMAGIDAVLLEVVNLFEEHCRVNHYTVADYADYFWAENARRNKMELKLSVGIDYCMAGIVTSRETYYCLRRFCQEVDYFPLALVSPLGANNRYN